MAMLVLVTVLALAAYFVNYEEDIAKFLPRNERTQRYADTYQRVARQDRVAIVFGADSPEELSDAMDTLAEVTAELDTAGWIHDLRLRVDEEGMMEVMTFVTSNYPYFLTQADYHRMDSLLKVPGYVAMTLAEDKQQLMLPTSSMFAPTLSSDPLHLFAPVIQRMQGWGMDNDFEVVDGIIYTPDGHHSLAYFSTQGAASESDRNARLAALLDSITERTQRSCPGVSVSAVGAPLIAATNANQIKRDSLLAMAVAVTLILLLLIAHYRSAGAILWIGVSLTVGWIFALAGMSLFADTVSIIVLGIGSVIIGIAANYPLHFLDHLAEVGDRRQALKEMVAPLFTGNITTVAAFLCLVWLDAQAMRHLGAFGALMLIGTILFVLVFLPLWARVRRSSVATAQEQSSTLRPKPMSPLLFWTVVALTLVLGYFSLHTRFDDDIRHINYMTAEQRDNLELLAGAADKAQFYAIAQGQSLDSALSANETLQRQLTQLGGDSLQVSGIGLFLPSRATQEQRLEQWRQFWALHASDLLGQLRTEAARQGFAADAFSPFESMLTEPLRVQPSSYFSPVFTAMQGNYIFTDSNLVQVVNYVSAAGDVSLEPMKNRLQRQLHGNLFAFSSKDVSNALVSVLNDSFNYIGLVCSCVVFLFLWFSFRRLELSLVSFLPLAVGWVWILGIMQLCGLQFNIVNIILATFIFGQGDDYTIFITEGLIHEHAYGRPRLASYKRSVMLSAVIMFVGIGSLVLAKHPALRSLALVTIIGMGTVVFMAYYLPPLVYNWITKEKVATPQGTRLVAREVPHTLSRLLRSLWGITFFVTMSTLLLKPYAWLFFKVKGENAATKEQFHGLLCRIGVWVAHHVPGMKMSLDNSVGESFEKPAILISNHQSHLDLMALMMLTPKIVFFANDWTWNNFFYGSVIRHADFLHATEGLDANFEKVKQLYEQGYTIAIFPEGTRSEEGHILRFHKGAFYLAQKLGADILPVVMHGLGHVLPKRDFMLRKGSVHVRVLPRITPGDSRFSTDYSECAKQVRHWFIDQYEALRAQCATADYCAVFARYQYMYKGAAVEARCVRNLKRNANYAAVVDDPANATLGTYVAHHCGQGELPLIFALAHPATQVIALTDDPDDLALMQALEHAPVNFHPQLEKEDENL